MLAKRQRLVRHLGDTAKAPVAIGITRLALATHRSSKCGDIGVMDADASKRTPRPGGMRHGVSRDQGFAVDSPGA